VHLRRLEVGEVKGRKQREQRRDFWERWREETKGEVRETMEPGCKSRGATAQRFLVGWSKSVVKGKVVGILLKWLVRMEIRALESSTLQRLD